MLGGDISLLCQPGMLRQEEEGGPDPGVPHQHSQQQRHAGLQQDQSIPGVLAGFIGRSSDLNMILCLVTILFSSHFTCFMTACV